MIRILRTSAPPNKKAIVCQLNWLKAPLVSVVLDPEEAEVAGEDVNDVEGAEEVVVVNRRTWNLYKYENEARI